jgi:phosphoglycolate phosphatase-like HAD superfamily hydrolase
VEHVIASGDSSEKENDAPIAEDPHRPRRHPRPLKRLIEEANIGAYALSVEDEIEDMLSANISEKFDGAILTKAMQIK